MEEIWTSKIYGTPSQPQQKLGRFKKSQLIGRQTLTKHLKLLIFTQIRSLIYFQITEFDDSYFDYSATILTPRGDNSVIINKYTSPLGFKEILERIQI